MVLSQRVVACPEEVGKRDSGDLFWVLEAEENPLLCALIWREVGDIFSVHKDLSLSEGEAEPLHNILAAYAYVQISDFKFHADSSIPQSRCETPLRRAM